MLTTLNKSTKANLPNPIESLKYARIIQKGLLPKRRHFNRLFADHFVIYKPLNYVSGDFYWIGARGNLTYIAVGDCTGHGVPGALLSVLARSILEYSIMNKGLVKTDKILREVDKKFIESFSGNGEELFNNDWVDIALVCLDRNENKLYFSSANRKLCHISDEKMEIIYGSSFPIGGWQVEQNRNFRATCINYKEGDVIFLGSDGFQDQLGGEKGKKYSSKRLHNFLAGISNLKMNEQKLLLEKEFNNWKGSEDQIDDVCILSIRL